MDLIMMDISISSITTPLYLMTLGVNEDNDATGKTFSAIFATSTSLATLGSIGAENNNIYAL